MTIHGNIVETGKVADVVGKSAIADLVASFNDVEAPVLELV